MLVANVFDCRRLEILIQEKDVAQQRTMDALKTEREQALLQCAAEVPAMLPVLLMPCVTRDE
jgi:hypothetical protein